MKTTGSPDRPASHEGRRTRGSPPWQATFDGVSELVQSRLDLRTLFAHSSFDEEAWEEEEGGTKGSHPIHGKLYETVFVGHYLFQVGSARDRSYSVVYTWQGWRVSTFLLLPVQFV